MMWPEWIGLGGVDGVEFRLDMLSEHGLADIMSRYNEASDETSDEDEDVVPMFYATRP